ncbi:hypothetical protein [Ideonella sp.]|uniref:hypothetical protein n=1 Tax=Ideonella sp. TaxID=1929293 RepID=UPI003BB5659E
MQVIVTQINPEQPIYRGHLRMPSFLAQFDSAGFSGSAWFVPATGNSSGYLGQRLDVELSHDRVTQVLLEDGQGFKSRVEPLPAPGAYRVSGTVSSMVPLRVPPGEAIVSVTAGDATFALTIAELAGIRPAPGIHLSFLVHDLSLWDEAL